MPQDVGYACLDAIAKAKLARQVEGKPQPTRDEIATMIGIIFSQFAKVPKKGAGGGPIPTPEEVAKYSAEIGYPMDGQKWCDFYAAKGWMVGRTRMKDWKAAVRNWKTSGWGIGTVALGAAKTKADSTNNYRTF